jgi:endogenous inhibitor of DNA gyrase (YacG/DUF329 family)
MHEDCPICGYPLHWDDAAGWECAECGEQVPGEVDGPDLSSYAIALPRKLRGSDD